MAKKPDVEALRAKAQQLLQASAPEILKDPTFTIPAPKVPRKPLTATFRAWSATRNTVLHLPGNGKIEFKGHEYSTAKIEEIQHLQELIRNFPSKFKNLTNS